MAEKLLELFKENMTCPFLLEFYMTLRLPPLQPEVGLGGRRRSWEKWVDLVVWWIK